MSVAMLSRV